MGKQVHPRVEYGSDIKRLLNATLMFRMSLLNPTNFINII
jgi:hypothetical protein